MSGESSLPDARRTSAKIKGHWLAGSLFPYLREPLEFYEACARCGDVVLGRLGPIPICVLSNPRDVERVLARDAGNYEQSRLLRRLKPLLGEGLLIAEGASHARQRPLVEQSVHAGIAASWAEATGDAAERFAASWKQGERRDLYPAMLQIVSEILTRVVFGTGQRAAEASAVVERAVDLATERMGELFPVPEVVPTRGNREYRHTFEEMEKVLAAAIREKRAISGTRSRLLSALITARGADGAKLSDLEIRDQIVMIYVAVRHNLAAALTWTFILLSQHRESYAKVLQEVVLGNRRPVIEVAEGLAYCDCVVKESLRLYPPVWQILRHVMRATEIGGQKVKAGTQLLMSQWVLHRNARFFDEPDNFLPERWEKPREEWNRCYFPFGLGPRACFGEELSAATAKLVLAVVTPKFRLSLVAGQEVKPMPGFALRPLGRLLAEAQSWQQDSERGSGA